MTGNYPDALRVALDTGTRKVMAVAFRPTETGIEVLATARREHDLRSMRDGQIHDIPAAAKVIREVMSELAKACRQAFSSAYVAAAGRALYTAPGAAESEFPDYREMTSGEMYELEWKAVAAAQAALQARLPVGVRSDGYYCVGHTVTRTWLDSEPIGNLLGQWGRCAAIRVIGTFLPRGVVDALEAAMAQSGLQIAGLTLEPIAALEAAVTPNMRHLNLALIDVGAGTSDIALTKDGTIHTYAMVPEAGDSITEALARALFLDFATAEEAKRRAGAGKAVRVRDVLGVQHYVNPGVLRELTAAAVSGLADRLTHALVGIGGARPDAVLLVGGGSLSPGLPAALARALDLPPARVAVRTKQAVAGVQGGAGAWDPDTITPLGIALLARSAEQFPLVRVQVGRAPQAAGSADTGTRWVRLFQPGACTVGEALRAAGVPLAAVVGRAGSGLTVTVNGEVRALPGQRAVSGRVWLDGAIVSLKTKCLDRAQVTWEPGQDGLPARATAADVIGDTAWLPLLLDGRPVQIPPLITVDDQPAIPDTPLYDRCRIDFRPVKTVADLAMALGSAGPAAAAKVTVTVGGLPLHVTVGATVAVDGRPAAEDTALAPGARVDWSVRAPTVEAALNAAQIALPAPITVKVNGETVQIDPPIVCRVGDQAATVNTPVADGDEIAVNIPVDWQPLLHQVLPSVAAAGFGEGCGGRLIISVDGEPAGFTTALAGGADIVVRWESGGLLPGERQG